MNKLLKYVLTIIGFSFSASFAQTSITFTFANKQITGSSTQFYEFDVMAQAGDSGTILGDNQVYLNYNNVAFGPNISSNGKITVTKGSLIQGTLPPPVELQLYDIINIEDNTSSRVAITCDLVFDGPDFGSELPTTPTQLLHISLEIQNSSESARLSFEGSLMDRQQFNSDKSINYSPVIATDTDDSLLTPTFISGSILKYPDKFQLYQNFPNPFNPLTTIRFDIPMTGSGPVDTKIDIYNSLGQMIKTLYQDKLSAGSYEVKWDGTTNTGNNAPSGIYFVIFKADKFTQTRKVVLVK
jgi:hypothetical protein